MNINDLSFKYGLQVIYEHANATLNENDKVGIVGVNGAGKSTLFNIILGILEPDGGSITFKKKSRIGYLPQVITEGFDSDITVFEYLLSARPITQLENKLTKLYERLALETDERKQNNIMKSINSVNNDLDYYDQYNYESILLKLIYGMGIEDELLEMKLCDLSGGQKSKIAFARLLFSKPSTILLDEPTNHLDASTKEYIINFLKSYNGLVLVISHDIEFLNAVTNKTLYIDKMNHDMEVYNGSYEKFKKIKEERESAKLKLYEQQKEEEEKLKKIINKYIRGNEKKANIAKDRQKKLAKLQENMVTIDAKQKYSRFKLSINHESTFTPIHVDNLSFGYNKDKILFSNLRFALNKGEKFLIVGENGIGKSTLLKLIIGLYEPLKGTIDLDDKVELAYYAQEHESLNNDETIVENFSDYNIDINELRSFLGSFLFFGDDVFKKINVLSPGERSRVALAKIALEGANLLLLDEPTNHLDPETQKIIAETFNTYEGTMLVVSHNLEFVKNLGIERMILLPSGEIKYFDEKIVLHYQELNSK